MRKGCTFCRRGSTTCILHLKDPNYPNPIGYEVRPRSRATLKIFLGLAVILAAMAIATQVHL